MDKTVQNWLKEFQENYPLPPPDDQGDATGWTLTIEELQDFSLSRELQSVPDTTTYGLKIYVSVFNTKTGLFHGRTWGSPLLTNTSTSVINLTTHGILVGKECLIIIEFSFLIRYFSNETSEKSLFFTVLYPFSSSQHICPLFIGSPRFLLQNPKDFAQYLTNRPGQLLIELQQNNDLLRAKEFMPPCTFMQWPPPGVIKLAPLSMNNVFPINLSDISLVVDPNFEQRVKQGFEQLFSRKYRVPAEDLLLRANKYLIQIAAHNGYTQLQEPFRIELQPKSYWKYDGQLTFKHFVNDSHFALLFLFIVNIEFNAECINKQNTSELPKKQMLEIPIGYSVTIPTKDECITIKWLQEARYCPFTTRICRAVENLPPLTYDVSYSPISGKANDINNLPVEFKTIIGGDGGTLTPFDPTNAPDTPLLAEEMLDKLNGNHLRLVIKFLVARADFTERFPTTAFPRVFFECEVWQAGIQRSPTCELEYLEEKIFCFDEKQSKDGKKGTMLSIDLKLPSTDHITNYFMLMKSNELQVVMRDDASKMVIGRFTIPTAALLRQRRPSLQFPAYSNIISDDGEPLGMIYFVCGNYGTNEGELDKNAFEQRNRIENGLIVAESMMKTDEEFRRLVQKSMQEPFELAMKYRDGKRKQIILNDMQKRFLRTKKIFPVPGIESKFTFVSQFDPSENMDIRISIDDERIRFLGPSNKQTGILDDLESRFTPIRNTDMKLIQGQNLTTIEKFSLISHGSDTISVAAGQSISLDFSFFTLESITNKEVTVTLLDKDNEVCDIFTIKIIASGDVAHEIVTKYIKKNSCLTATLSTALSLKDAIAASDLITAENSTSGVRLSSAPLEQDVTTLVFLFGEDGSLVKVCKIIVLLTPSEVLTAGSRLKVVLKHVIGNTIVCRSNNSRVAQFTSHLTPTLLSPPGEVTAIAVSGGTALLTIYDMTSKELIRNIVVNIGAARGDEEQKCIDKIQISLPVGTLSKRAVRYKNNTTATKHITLTTSHPEVVTFDPVSYDIASGEETRFKIHFLPHAKAETVSLYVFLQERRATRRAQEYYRFQIKYE